MYATLSLVGYICSIRFPDAWVLHVRALYSQATYMGHLEGPHTALTNDRRIRAMMHKANQLFGDTPVHLVEPSRTAGRAIDGSATPEGEPARRETLPAVCCIGAFEADPVPGADGCASGLLVVWFQEAPPPVPIEPEIVDLFSRIDWDAPAASYWY